MSAPRPAARPDPRTTRRTLALITLVAVAPFVASYLAYYVFPRGSYVNYGTLLAVPAADVQGRTTSGEPFTLASLRGKWALVTAAPGACDATCRQALYATRQARTMQGRELDRVVRVWIVTDGVAPPAGLLAEHPGLLVVSAARSDVLAAWPGGNDALYLLDPLGNLVMRYPRDPDIAALAKDLGRVLRASSIG